VDYDRLVNRHKDAVYRQMVRTCGNYDDAEDVLAEALFQAYRASDQLRDEAQFRAWLATIGRRVCSKMRKREALLPIMRLGEVEVPTQALELDQGELKSCVTQAVDALPDGYREVYLQREIEGRRAEDVAKTLGLTVAAVKSRLHRARTMVRAALDASICGNQ
jgi:RNA polymerase sigma-70 factor, ECF subfamily